MFFLLLNTPLLVIEFLTFSNNQIVTKLSYLDHLDLLTQKTKGNPILVSILQILRVSNKKKLMLKLKNYPKKTEPMKVTCKSTTLETEREFPNSNLERKSS